MSDPLTSDGWPRKPRNVRCTNGKAWLYVDGTGIDICIESSRPVGHAKVTWRQIEAALAARLRAASRAALDEKGKGEDRADR